MTKICTICKNEKEFAEFYKKVNGLNGLHAWCKECMKEKEKQWRKDNPEKYYEKNFKYYYLHLQSNKARYKKFLRENPDYFKKYYHSVRKYKKEPKKDLAQRLVNSAIKKGLLERPKNCRFCKGTKRIEAHHMDYDKPYEVIWLCRTCHKRYHSGVKAEIYGKHTHRQPCSYSYFGARSAIDGRE